MPSVFVVIGVFELLTNICFVYFQKFPYSPYIINVRFGTLSAFERFLYADSVHSRTYAVFPTLPETCHSSWAVDDVVVMVVMAAAAAVMVVMVGEES